MVCAFAGWNDAAGAATTALTAAAESLDAEVIAQIDPEEFFDFQANRPTISLAEGQARQIEWPGNVLMAARAPGAERDLVLLAGTEPNLRWRTFSDGVASAAETLGIEMVVTMGALIADVTHTLPVPITGLASGSRAGRSPRPLQLQLRGADRRRRGRPRRLRQARHPLRKPLGRGPPLRRGGPEPEGGACPLAPARGPGRRGR